MLTIIQRSQDNRPYLFHLEGPLFSQSVSYIRHLFRVPHTLSTTTVERKTRVFYFTNHINELPLKGPPLIFTR